MRDAETHEVLLRPTPLSASQREVFTRPARNSELDKDPVAANEELAKLNLMGTSPTIACDGARGRPLHARRGATSRTTSDPAHGLPRRGQGKTDRRRPATSKGKEEPAKDRKQRSTEEKRGNITSIRRRRRRWTKQPDRRSKRKRTSCSRRAARSRRQAQQTAEEDQIPLGKEGDEQLTDGVAREAQR